MLSTEVYVNNADNVSSAAQDPSSTNQSQCQKEKLCAEWRAGGRHKEVRKVTVEAQWSRGMRNRPGTSRKVLSYGAAADAPNSLVTVATNKKEGGSLLGFVPKPKH